MATWVEMPFGVEEKSHTFSYQVGMVAEPPVSRIVRGRELVLASDDT